MEAIRADLNERGVAGSEATLVEAHKKTWRTGALGCPIPGAIYTQALVDGWQVVVKVGDTTYDYRFGSTPSPTLCEDSLPDFRWRPHRGSLGHLIPGSDPGEKITKDGPRRCGGILGSDPAQALIPGLPSWAGPV